MEIMGIGGVAAITIVCLLIGLWVKNSKFDDRWIPCIVGTVGMVLGLVAWKVMPNFPAEDPVTAIAVGIVSGLAATGAHQIYKQLTYKHPDGGAGDEGTDSSARLE